VILAVVAAATALPAAARPPASSFTAHVDNPWFPLLPGMRWTYVGVKDGKPTRDIVTVTHAVKTIDGVPCVSVADRLYEAGRLEERTTDWYSQDRAGNVWYFGEDTAELDRKGRVTSTEGTWRTGVNGAVAGIYFPAAPRVGQSGRQEYYKGHAEDRFKVAGRLGTNAVLTSEWTPLEPGTLDHKLYVRGTGIVLEQTERGPNERNELVSFTRSAH
jgi:hypothetical protein